MKLKNSFCFFNLKNFSPKFFDSTILNQSQSFKLISLCDFSVSQKWKCIYRASNDGYSSETFHFKCDRKSSTLIILKAAETGFIFGGYTEASWDGDEIQKFDPNAFIFSLKNGENNPIKLKPNNFALSIFCSRYTGPSFGRGDIHIESNSNIKGDYDSFSDMGDVFDHPRYSYGTNEAQSFLAGSYHFKLSEIEVFQKE